MVTIAYINNATLSRKLSQDARCSSLAHNKSKILYDNFGLFARISLDKNTGYSASHCSAEFR